MDLIDKIIKETPLDIRLNVDNEMNLIDFLTEIGFREDKMWTDSEEDVKLVNLIEKFSKKMTDSQLKIIEIWEKDGKPK